MKDKEYKHKRNHNEILNQNSSLLPKIKCYNFLNNKIIDKVNIKVLVPINNDELYKNIEDNTINIYIKKITNIKAYIPKIFLIKLK